jgi:replicative DNA helicase
MSDFDQETAKLKMPPHSAEAEQAVLGGLMLDNRTWEAVSEVVTENDFYRHEHRLIYKALVRLHEQEKPQDMLTVSQELEQLAELDSAGGLAYLADLTQNTPSVSNIKAYADIVYERAVLRSLIYAAGTIADDAFEPLGRNSEELLLAAEKMVAQIAEGGSKKGGPELINPILTRTVEKIDELFNQEEGLTGITTGFTELDARTNGFQEADMVVLAARPSMGKTTLAMNLVENALMGTGKPCIVFSMEMPSESIVMRMLSSIGKIDQGRVRSGKFEEEDWPKLTAAVNLLKDKPLYIDDTAALNPQEMRARCRSVYREHGEIGLIMVDYIQLMTVAGSGEGRSQEISEISRSLKGIAKEFKCPIVALSQLNRALEQRPNKRPVMSDLRESGAIEQDADIIMFIYRDEVYNEDTPDKGIGEIIIAKHRNGEIGTDRLAFIGRHTKFENLAHGYEGAGDDY